MTLIKSKHKSQHGQQSFTKSGDGDLRWRWEYGLDMAAVGRAVRSVHAQAHVKYFKDTQRHVCLFV